MTNINGDHSDNGWMSNIEGLPEQIEAITSLSPLTVVSAGAGTGKTQTLSQRFAWLLSNDKDCRVDQILVLTFTEKAAREMQDRIKKTVIKWHENSAGQLSHLHESIQRIDDAYISTIHSFAMKVIRESGLVLNIDPSAGIVPKTKEELWWKSFSEALGMLSAAQIKYMLSEEWVLRADELFSDADLSEFVTSYGAGALAAAAKNASEKLGSCGRTPEDLWNQTNENLLEDIRAQQDIFNDIWNLWQDIVFPEVMDDLCSNPGTGCFLQMRDAACKYSGKDPTGQNMREFADVLLNEVLGRLPGGSNSKIKRKIEDVLGSKLGDWRDKTKKQVLMATEPSERESRLLHLFNHTCALGWQCWESLRELNGMLSNNDLIRYAGDVVKKNPDYGTKFKHILIDEFQDTDGLQDKLLRVLWKEGCNTLFIVGDLKQSIYRFRHANLLIFQEYINMAKKCTDGRYRYITLDKSFRTRDKLLDKFNCIFTDIWKEGIEEGSQMMYEPLAGAGLWKLRNCECSDPVLEVFISAENRELRPARSGKDEKWFPTENKVDVRERLFRNLALLIAEIHAAKAKIWDKNIEDKENKDECKKNKFREVCWKDFAVLVPARTVYPVIERAFEAIGVPYVLCTSKDYFARAEVADLVNFVSMLADPGDPLYLAGWLSSPFSGISPDTAEACIDAAYSRLAARGRIPLSDVVMEKIPETWTKILRLKATAELRGVSAAILEILKSREYLNFYEPKQRRKVDANIACLADIAAEYEMSQGRSLTGCADYMQFAVSEAQQKEEPEVTDEDQDAVNILTIHAAKGLEYPIVALSGVEETVHDESGISTSVRYGVNVKDLPGFLTADGEKKIPTVTGAWHRELEKKAALAEKERFWYVASTRAMDKLILCGTAKRDTENNIMPPKDESFLAHVLSVKERNADLCEVSYLERGKEPAVLYKMEDKNTAADKYLGLKTVSPPKLARISASAFAMLSWCPAAYRIAYRQGRNMKWAANNDGEGTGGSEFGTLAHWLLARWDFNKASVKYWLPERNLPGQQGYEDLLRKIPFELRSEFKSEKSRYELRRMFYEYAEGDEGRYLASLASGLNPSLQRETPFRVQDGNLLLVGATDIFWEDPNGVHLRDWKTTAEDFAPSKYYEYQLMFYGYAMMKYRLEKKYKELPIYININYLRTDDFKLKKENIVFDVDMADKYRKKIHMAAESALSDVFVRNNENCILCPWRNFCKDNSVFCSEGG